MQVNINNINHIYFLGIGGIGMSALARYFSRHGIRVEGYDRTCTPLTEALESEGIPVHYIDDPSAIPANIDVCVYTPAIPGDLKELTAIKKSGVPLMKRSAMLGSLSQSKPCIAVAGSHGKTTTTSLIAYLLQESNHGCLAFLGGIAKNYNSNYIEDPDAAVLVAEADEYDRSFLQLSPSIAVITAIDPDHLDIYGDLAALKSAFADFIKQIRPAGTLLIKEGLDFNFHVPDKVKVYTYGFSETADFHPINIHLMDGIYYFRLVSPLGVSEEFHLNIPGYINIENACAALGVCLLQGMSSAALVSLLPGYQGVVRRLDKRYDAGGQIYIDDYAHHPRELGACISSVRLMYPGKKITGIFQPHLYSRTRDLADEFATCLSALDEIIVLDIYPAREEPIPGIDAQFLLDRITHPLKKYTSKENLLNLLQTLKIEVLLTLGAGDIDQFVDPIVNLLTQKANHNI